MEAKRRLKQYFAKRKKDFVLLIVFSLFYVLSQLSQPFLLGRALDSASNSDRTAFFALLITALVLVIVGTVSGYLFEVTVGNISQRTIKQMRDDVYEKINSISIKDFDKRVAGDLIQLEIRDIENVATGIYAVFKSLIQGLFTIIITIIMMFMVNWILALGVILLSPLSALMSSFVAKFSHKSFKKQADLQAELNAISLETITNIDIVQSFNSEAKINDKFQNINAKLQKEGRIAQFSASWINPSTRLVNNTIYVIIGIVGIIMLSYEPDLAIVFAVMSIGRLSSFLSYTNQYSKPFNEISSVIGEYESAKYSFRRINDFLNLENDIDDGTENASTIDSITFDKLYFSYSDNKPLINDFNLSIKRGQKVAIVGPTGAGKTTLINLIMRFYEPNKGEILINDKPLSSYSKESYRDNFGMVLQDTWIFKGTILDNVRYVKKEASDKEVIEACQKAHIDSFINSLPDGYLTMIGMKDGLSEGQRQMIAIARVMLLNPEIVILDEATSNIDTRSEMLINEAFDEMMKNKTAIVIAHRLSTIVSSDVIIVIKDGDIVETGNHKELMEKKGFYYSLYSSQF